MFTLRNTSSRLSINSSLRSLYMNKICKSYLNVFHETQTVFYCTLKKTTNSATSNKFNKQIYNHDNSRINQHGQQNTDLHENALNFRNSMKKIQDIKKLDHPMSELRKIYDIVNSELDRECLSVSYFTRKNATEPAKMMVKCNIDVTWPSNMSFSHEAENKKVAKLNAALKCLHWLDKNEKIRNEKPLLYDKKDIEHILKEQETVEINLESEFKNEIQTLIHTFTQTIEPVIKEQPMIDFEANGLDETEHKYEANSACQTRNDILARQLKNRKYKLCDLPVYDYRQEILDKLRCNQVLLIKGSTGCGKSTQVPQFIIDEYIKQYRGSECNIIVTQPRRVAAISLAHRVATERNEVVGDVIGYHVRFNSKKPTAHGSIVFSTSGMLVRMLENNPTLEGISHVIVDEAHDRSLANDLLLKLMKEILQKNQSIKLIIMSATINENLFQQYFSCEVIDIPGKLYPVKMHFKEDIQFFKSTSKKRKDLNIPFYEIVRLIEWIVTTKPRGSILCFLPGWQEIKELHNLLEATSITNLLILPLHSKVSHQDQLKVFSPVPEYTRKVILATDIAECSITIDEVCYVIDTAIKREHQWCENESEMVLKFNLVSKANINQRKGRAGRTKPGESYHLITRKEYDALRSYPNSGIFTESLEGAIITSKRLSNEKVNDFFSSMLEAPGSKSIFNAVQNLKALRILDDDENLTDLGKRVSYFSLNPKLSRAVVLSCVFQCLNPILILVSLAFSGNSTLSLDHQISEKSCVKSQKVKFHETSDHIAMLRYYHHWLQYDDKYENSFTPSYFNSVIQFYKLHTGELVDSGMFNSLSETENVNMFKDNYELIRAVLFAGTNHLIKRNAYGRKGHFTKKANSFRSEDDNLIDIGNDSVNHKRKNWPSDIMTYLKRRRFSGLSVVHETSMLTPLSVLLFTDNDVRSYQKATSIPTEHETIYIEIENIENIILRCDKDTATLLLQFRRIIWDIANYVIKYEGVNTNTDNLKIVQSYKTKVMTTLASILHKSSTDIDASTKF